MDFSKSNNNVDSNVDYSVQDLNLLKKKISHLDKTQQLEILKIINKDKNNKLTENKNGIFINLNNVSSKTITDIKGFVKYSIDNLNRLKKLEKLSDDFLKEAINKNKYDKYNFSSDHQKNIISSENGLEKKNQNSHILKKEISEEILEDKKKEKDMNFISNDLLDYNEELECENNIQDDICDDNVVDDFSERKCEEEGKKDNIESDDIINLQSKKNKFSGRNARLMKKCKEINRACQYEMNLYNFNNIIKNEEDDEDIDDDDLNLSFDEITTKDTSKSLKYENINNELTEEAPLIN